MAEFLVIGATGKTGARVVNRLADAGATVRAGSRHPAPDRPGVRGVTFDWDRPEAHDEALDGVDAVYVIPPALRADATTEVGGLVDRIVASGRGTRVVFLSARGVDADDAIPLRRIELHLEASGLPWSVVRPSWFAQNFTEGVFAADVAAGVLAVPTGDGLEPFIDADDIADVAAALLLDDTHDGAAYDLSGPEAITWARAAELLGEASGRSVEFRDVDPEQWRAGAVAAGLPADYAALLGSLFEVIRNGWDAAVSDGTERVLGRPGRRFEDWAATAYAGV